LAFEANIHSDKPDFTFEYLHGQMRATHADLLRDFERRSLESVAAGNATLDLRYGPAPRQTLDVFLAARPVKGTIAYFHPGYWQSRDKSTFRFLGPAFARRGYNFVLVNYPLCPDVALAGLVDAASAAIPFLLDHLGADHPSNRGLIAAGHSAGGHIAVELVLRSWPASLRSGRPIERIVAISGVYDLAPLLDTPLNQKLKLSPADAARNSPLLRVRAADVPAVFMVGGAETSEFLRQSREMAEAWRAAGNLADYIEAPGADHFSVLEPFLALQSPVLVEALR
jgi:arylformamidase